MTYYDDDPFNDIFLYGDNQIVMNKYYYNTHGYSSHYAELC
jgi:hypothetical protein